MNLTRHRTFKDELYEQFARVTKALGASKRLELIDLLAQGERTVERLAEATGMSIANTSQHLKILKAARLVDVRREGLYAYYRLSNEHVYQVWQSIRELGESQLAELNRVVDTYLSDRSSLDAVAMEDLLERLDTDEVLLLDVRPRDEYAAGHIPGARTIPIQELRKRLGELPKTKQVVAYCRGPYCVYADEAVALLHEHGYDAARLEGGLPDWKAAGYPVAKEEKEQG